MSANVKVYGELVDITKSDSISVAVENVEELKKILFSKYPALASKTFVIAIGNKIVSGNSKISEVDQIALLPPFAGG